MIFELKTHLRQSPPTPENMSMSSNASRRLDDVVSEASLMADEALGTGASRRLQERDSKSQRALRMNKGRQQKKKYLWWRDHDNFERLRVLVRFCVEIYRIMMGTFLSLFVPHR